MVVARWLKTAGEGKMPIGKTLVYEPFALPVNYQEVPVFFANLYLPEHVFEVNLPHEGILTQCVDHLDCCVYAAVMQGEAGRISEVVDARAWRCKEMMNHPISSVFLGD